MTPQTRALTNQTAMRAIARLTRGPVRFNQLERDIAAPSPFALASVLRKLERDGIVTRKVIHPFPPALAPSVSGRFSWNDDENDLDRAKNPVHFSSAFREPKTSGIIRHSLPPSSSSSTYLREPRCILQTTQARPATPPIRESSDEQQWPARHDGLDKRDHRRHASPNHCSIWCMVEIANGRVAQQRLASE